MNQHARHLVALAALACSAAQAQTSQVFLQNAKEYGIGNTIYLYSLPVKNGVDGTVSYWDAQIVVEAAADTGKPNKVSLSQVLRSPRLKQAEFVVGAYKDVNAASTCSLTASPFNGRNEYSLDCTDDSNGARFTALWYTGPIAGHPYETELVNAKLDTIPGSSEYSWGKVVYPPSSNWYSCFNYGELISARQIGNTLTLIDWGSNDIEDCRISFIRQ